MKTLLPVRKIPGFRLLLLILLVFFSVTGCNYIEHEEAMKKVKSTDLSSESIGGIKIGVYMKDVELLHAGNPFKPRPENDEYERNYDQYYNKYFELGIHKPSSEILYVSTGENKKYSTKKGIKVGASIEEVKKAYGQDYFIYTDREQKIYEIGYVDRENNIELHFTYLNKKVDGIYLGYAFNRIIWY
ncbi:hypothetical protein V1498_07400 [Peribacillus sp. SCS-26]|uniref:hypothetical protein n=1 Tax=Paraperibacillus marinus TaxID=3115295 RepID=UPI003905B0D1